MCGAQKVDDERFVREQWKNVIAGHTEHAADTRTENVLSMIVLVLLFALRVGSSLAT